MYAYIFMCNTYVSYICIYVLYMCVCVFIYIFTSDWMVRFFKIHLVIMTLVVYIQPKRHMQLL